MTPFNRPFCLALLTLFSTSVLSDTMAAPGSDPQAFSRISTPNDARAPALRLDTPSGLPVPRFVSLKASKTFCRGGPTFAHPVRITYQRKGLPVMVIAETRDHWRKIRDSEGDECWIHRTKLSGASTVMVVNDGLAIRARPRRDAAQRAQLGVGVVAIVEKTSGRWIKISTGGIKGWTERSGLWGAQAR